jgi:hypothetical protein
MLWLAFLTCRERRTVTGSAVSVSLVKPHTTDNNDEQIVL